MGMPLSAVGIWTGMESLGARLRRLRKDRGLSQEQVVALAGIGLDQTAVSKIENGTNKEPSVFTMVAIARALDTSMDDLMDGIGSGKATTPRPISQRLARTLEAVSSRRRASDSGKRPDLSLVPAGPTASVLAAHQRTLEALEGRVEALEARPAVEEKPRKPKQRGTG